MEVNTKCPECGCVFGTKNGTLEFNRIYINAKELSEISGMSYNECLNVINRCRVIMQEKNYYVPESTKPKIALFKIVCAFLGIAESNDLENK